MGRRKEIEVPRWVLPVGWSCVLGISVTSIVSLTFCSNDEVKDYYYNTIVVSNGELTTTYNNISKEYHTADFEVIHQDDNSLVVFVYGNDHGQRYIYTNYILDNINFEKNDDGSYRVVFDKENINDDNYLTYVNNIENKNNNVQRVRS